MKKSKEQDDKQMVRLEKRHCYGSCGARATLTRIEHTCNAKFQCRQ